MIDNIRDLKESTSNLRYVTENIEGLHTNIRILPLICIFQTMHNIISCKLASIPNQLYNIFEEICVYHPNYRM